MCNCMDINVIWCKTIYRWTLQGTDVSFDAGAVKRDSWCWRRAASLFWCWHKMRDSFNAFQRAEVPYALWCFNQSYRLGDREIRTTVISHLVSSIAQHFTPRFINCAEGCQGQLRRFVTRSMPRRSLTHWSASCQRGKRSCSSKGLHC